MEGVLREELMREEIPRRAAILKYSVVVGIGIWVGNGTQKREVTILQFGAGQSA